MSPCCSWVSKQNKAREENRRTAAAEQKRHRARFVMRAVDGATGCAAGKCYPCGLYTPHTHTRLQ